MRVTLGLVIGIVSTSRFLHQQVVIFRIITHILNCLLTFLGEPHKKAADYQKVAQTDYDKLVELFYKRLAEQRQYNQVRSLCRTYYVVGTY